jgi:cysteine-rich repeat protein
MRVLLLLLLLAGCARPVADRPPPTQAAAPFCGDGLPGPFEACDDGAANSADRPDACRPDCSLPRCGDGVWDEAEGCDDGNDLGGDGCSPACAEEDGPFESEPNDVPNTAGPITPGTWTRGGAQGGDVDCFTFAVPEDGWAAAQLVGVDGDACPAAAILSLHDPLGVHLAQGTGACPSIDPVRDAGARFLTAGAWRVCVQGLYGDPVPAYDLRVEVGEGSCALEGVVVDPREDPDGDGVANRCDPDDDGDGAADGDDNCPLDPNTLDAEPLTVDSRGYLHHWLTIGEWHGLETTADCLPSPDQLLGADDALAEPHLGDVVGDLTWLPWINRGRRIDFLDRYGGDTPREIYAVTWVRSEVERDAVLALGVDDGYFAWLNGELVGEVQSCQGVNNDQFQHDVTLLAGWNRLTIKVRDQGGGWGMMGRFRDADGPITDLEVSMSPDGTWQDDQGDLDGDGVGDACDDTPAG